MPPERKRRPAHRQSSASEPRRESGHRAGRPQFPPGSYPVDPCRPWRPGGDSSSTEDPAPAPFDHREVAGRQLVHALEDRMRGWHIGEAEVGRQCRPVEARRHRRMGQQCFQLRAEEDKPVAPGPIERLDPQAVARQGQTPFPAIPERKGEHADQAVQAPRPRRARAQASRSTSVSE